MGLRQEYNNGGKVKTVAVHAHGLCITVNTMATDALCPCITVNNMAANALAPYITQS